MKALTQFGFVTFFAAVCASAAPANDNFTNAWQLASYISSTNGTSVGATKEPGEPNHAGNAGGSSVWYRWSPPFSGIVTFNTFGSSFDTVMAVYTNAAFGLLVSNDDFGGSSQSRVSFFAFVGTTYFVAVDGYNGATGAVKLSWTEFPFYPNDNFSNALALPGTNGTTFGCNIFASQEAGEPHHVGDGVYGQRTIWYHWTAPFTGTASFDTIGSAIDTVLAAYTGTNVAALTVVAGSYDIAHGGYIQSEMSFACVAGQDYKIVVDSQGTLGQSGISGATQLNWESYPAITNDPFANPQNIPGSSGLLRNCNVTATQETNEPAYGSNNSAASMWYRWFAPRDGTVTFNTFGTFLDTVLTVYTGTVLTNLTLVAQNDQFVFQTDQSRVQFTATAGTEYRISMAGFNNPTKTKPELGKFNLAWQMDAPPNDNFSNAVTLAASGTLTQSTMLGTKETGEPNHGGDAGGSSVWFNWLAPSNGPVTFDTQGSAFDTSLGIYTGSSVGALSLVVSNGDVNVSAALLYSRVQFTAVAGQTYRVAVDGFKGEDSFLQLNWGYVSVPNINIAAQGTNVVLSWTAPNCYLENISTLGGASAVWTAQPGGPPIVLPANAAAQQFFRLISP